MEPHTMWIALINQERLKLRVRNGPRPETGAEVVELPEASVYHRAVALYPRSVLLVHLNVLQIHSIILSSRSSSMVSEQLGQ